MNNENEKIMQYQKEIMANTLSNSINATTNTVREITTKPSDKNQMPEYVFQCIFAPYFASLRDPNVDKSKINPELKGRWLGIAGSQFKGVDLVDNKGNIVDTTPGFYCQPDNNEQLEDVDYNAISNKYISKKNRLAADGENYINNELSSINNKMVSVDKRAHFMAEWDRLLDKYLIKEEEETSTISKESVKNISDTVKSKLNINSSELDYD